MSHTTAAPITPALPTIPLIQIGTWVAFYGLLAMLAIFFVSASQGAIALPAGTGVHEWVHDARHLLGFPCH